MYIIRGSFLLKPIYVKWKILMFFNYFLNVVIKKIYCIDSHQLSVDEYSHEIFYSFMLQHCGKSQCIFNTLLKVVRVY